jgi:polyferredoxin
MNQVLLTIAIITTPIFLPWILGRVWWSILCGIYGENEKQSRDGNANKNEWVPCPSPNTYWEHMGNGALCIVILGITGLVVWGAYVLAGKML